LMPACIKLLILSKKTIEHSMFPEKSIFDGQGASNSSDK
jgi:hypothetical protein